MEKTKKILLTAIMICTLNISFAQKGTGEKMRSFKIAYITEQLNLDSKEAQEFWPIYNKYQETTRQLKQQERRLFKDLKETNAYESLSEKEAEDTIRKYIEIRDQKNNTKKIFIKNLAPIIPQKKILKLIKAEADFNRRLLKQLRDRRKE